MKWFSTILVFTVILLVPVVVSAQSPFTVDILWEADTYVPDTYAGHTLPSSESSVRAIAIVSQDGVLLDTDALVFTWSQDGVQDLPSSGPGKDVYTFTAAKKFGKTTIKVAVSSGGKSPRVEKSITISTSEPRVVLYPYDTSRSLRGEIAYGSQVSVDGGTLSVKAEPYYFSRTRTSDVVYRFSQGNTTLTPTDADKSIMTFGVAEGVTGNVDIRVLASHFNNILQTASRSLRIIFNQEALRF